MLWEEIESEDLTTAAKMLATFLSTCEVWPDGSVVHSRQLVDRINGLTIYIYPREHNPPHFHVRYSGMEACYRIDTCELMHGDLGPKNSRILQDWFDKIGNTMLKRVWDDNWSAGCVFGRSEEHFPSRPSIPSR